MAKQYNFKGNSIELPPLITNAARTPATMQKRAMELWLKFRGNIRNKTLKSLGNIQKKTERTI